MIKYIDYLRLENNLNKELISAQKEHIKTQAQYIQSLENNLFELRFKIHTNAMDGYIAVQSEN